MSYTPNFSFKYLAEAHPSRHITIEKIADMRDDINKWNSYFTDLMNRTGRFEDEKEFEAGLRTAAGICISVANDLMDAARSSNTGTLKKDRFAMAVREHLVRIRGIWYNSMKDVGIDIDNGGNK